MDNTNKDIFKVGDFVIIKQDNSDLNTLGKIEEIFEEDGNLLFRYNEYYFPEKTQGIYSLFIIQNIKKPKSLLY